MTPLAELESARSIEQQKLDGAKPHAERNRLGQFATPYPLALDIARAVAAMWPDDAGAPRFFEPALGTGAFYSAALEAFDAPFASASGVEIDPSPAATAERTWAASGLSVVNADFTRLEPPKRGQRATLVLTNPPYSRHHHLGEDKTRLQAVAEKRSGIAVSGLAGLYVHFMLLAHEWMEEGALAAWLIPSEFMEVNFGRALRAYLSDRVTLRRIHLFDPTDTQFADALVSSAVVIFEKRASPHGRVVRLSHGGSVTEPRKWNEISVEALRAAGKWTSLFPGAVGAVPSNVSAARSLFDTGSGSSRNRPAAVAMPRLGDLFQIKRGLVTGGNGFFVMPRKRAAELGLPDFALTPMLPSPRHLPATVVEADGKGWPLLDPQLVLVGTDMLFVEVERVSPELAAYVRQGEAEGVNRGYITSRREPWYMPERRVPAPFLCTYMGRDRSGGAGSPFRVVWNQSGALASNVWLMLYPKETLATRLADNPGLYPAVHAALREAVVAAGRGGRVYGGGLHKFEPSELAAVAASGLAR